MPAEKNKATTRSFCKKHKTFTNKDGVCVRCQATKPLKKFKQLKRRKAVSVRPKVKELREIYKDLLSSDQQQRLNALSTAVQWYDQAFGAYKVYRTKKDGTVDLTLDEWKAVKEVEQHRRATAASGDHLKEREESLRQTIFAFEKVMQRLKPTPITKVLEKFFEQKDKLVKKEERLNERYAKVISELTKALKPVNMKNEPITLTVSETSKDRIYSRDFKNITFSRSRVKALTDILRKRGLYALVIAELKIISHVAAAEYNRKKDHDDVNPVKNLEKIFQMLQNFLEYLESGDAPKRLVKLVGRIASEPTERKVGPRVARKSNGIGRGEKLPHTWYTIGSALSKLMVRMSTEEKFTMAELQKGIDADLNGRLRSLKNDGPGTGKWKLEFDTEGKVRMLLTDETFKKDLKAFIKERSL